MSRGGVSSTNINIPKRFPMNKWWVGMDTLPWVEVEHLVAIPQPIMNKSNESPILCWNNVNNWEDMKWGGYLSVSRWGYLVATSWNGYSPMSRGLGI